MKVLLLGATGRLGRCVLRALVNSGYTVHVLVRYRERLPFQHSNVKVYIGDVSNFGHLKEALQECDAVLNTLNIARTSDFPWAKLRTPVTFLSDTMKVLIPTMAACEVKRVVITSAWGVADSKTEIPGWFRWLIDHSNIKYAYEDHLRQENLLKSSELDWTIIRPVGLTNGNKMKKTVISQNGEPRPRLTISRSHVSQVMLKVLNEATYIHEVLTVSEK